MGFFRVSSNSAPTDTEPASTTLSARTPLLRYPRLTLASALACVGIFTVAAVNATPGSTATPTRVSRSESQTVLHFTPDPEQPAPASEPAADPPAQTSVETNVSVSDTGDSAPTTNVSVNGQQVPVPEHGTVTHVSEDGNTKTTVHVDSDNHGNSRNSSYTSVNLNVHSSSHSDTDKEP